MCLFLFRICAFSNMFQLCSKVLTVSRWIVTHALIPDSGSGSVHKFPSILSLRAPNGGQALQPRFFPRESNSLTRSSSHSAREENEEAPATQILADSFLPPSVVPCAVLLLETPSGASYRKSLPKAVSYTHLTLPTKA